MKNILFTLLTISFIASAFYMSKKLQKQPSCQASSEIELQVVELIDTIGYNQLENGDSVAIVKATYDTIIEVSAEN